jgi:hypothetical protein
LWINIKNYDNLNFLVVNENNIINNISYKNYNLFILNNYKKQKDLSNKKLKAMKYIINDILKDNPWIEKDDVFEILKIFYSQYWSNKYIDSKDFKNDIYSYFN